MISVFFSADALAALDDTYAGCQSALVAPTTSPHVNHINLIPRPFPHCSLVLPLILSTPELHAMSI
jgi:hypothetical protein